MATKKQFTRSKSNKMLAGVCAGTAEYFGWDVTLTRVGFVVVSVLSTAFPGLIVYIAAAIIMPEGE